MIRSLHWDDCKKSNAKNFWKIAYPASLEGLLLVLLSSVDLIMISSLGVEATSAVGIFSQPKMVLLCLPRSFAVAVTAHIAVLYGGGKKQDIPFCMKQALVLIAIAGGVLIGIAFLLLQPILLLAGAQKEYLALAMTYSKLVVISLYFSSLSIVLHAGLMAVGKSGIMMISNVLGNIVNVCINALLIHGIGFFPKMGVKGAALGTFIGAFVTLLFTLAVVLKKENIVHICGKKGWIPKKKYISAFGGMFVGAFSEQSAERVGMFLYSYMAAGLGTLSFAVHTVCMNLCDIYYSFAQGMGKASLVLSASHLAAKKEKDFYHCIMVGQQIGFLLSLIACILYIIFRTPLIGLYHSENEVLQLGQNIMFFVAVVSFPEAQSLICAGVLRGAGKIKYVAIYSLLSIAVWRPIFTWLLCYVLGFGIYGAWIALFVDQSTRSICSMIGIRNLNKKLQLY